MSTSSSPLIPLIQSALEHVYDPEFGVSIADLGLIYDITDHAGDIAVTMTLTSMYCPAGEVILAGVKSAAESVAGVKGATVNLVWEPLWTPDRLSPKAREDLGWDRTPIA
jgi:metal-sulfur cluster biosynthetic enzyme